MKLLLLTSLLCLSIIQINSQFASIYYTSPNYYFPRQQSVAVPTAPPLLTTKNSDKYNGYGYHTTYQDGATSTVLFLSGYLQGDFQNNHQTLASDMLDRSRFPNPTQQINQAITGQPRSRSLTRASDLSPLIQHLFQNPTSLNGFKQFYSDSALEMARSLNISLSSISKITSDTFDKNDIESTTTYNASKIEVTTTANNSTETTTFEPIIVAEMGESDLGNGTESDSVEINAIETTTLIK